MEIKFDPQFRKQYKKADVRIKNQVRDRLRIFKKNPEDLQFNNHLLKRGWEGYRSIDITADLRAIYTEKAEGKELIAYFVALGTHDNLYSD